MESALAAAVATHVLLESKTGLPSHCSVDRHRGGYGLAHPRLASVTLRADQVVPVRG